MTINKCLYTFVDVVVIIPLQKQSTKNKETCQMANNFTVTKIAWSKVAAKVSEIAGKPYSAQYIRDVATGYRTNKQLAPILKDLGLTNKGVA